MKLRSDYFRRTTKKRTLEELFAGTQKDNMKDCVAKGRHYTPWSNEERRRHGYQGNLRAK